MIRNDFVDTDASRRFYPQTHPNHSETFGL